MFAFIFCGFLQILIKTESCSGLHSPSCTYLPVRVLSKTLLESVDCFLIKSNCFLMKDFQISPTESKYWQIFLFHITSWCFGKLSRQNKSLRDTAAGNKISLQIFSVLVLYVISFFYLILCTCYPAQNIMSSRPFIWRRSCSSPLILLLWFDVSGSLCTCLKCPTLAQFFCSFILGCLEGWSVQEMGLDFSQGRDGCLPEIKQTSRIYQVNICFTSRMHSIAMCAPCALTLLLLCVISVSVFSICL